MLCDESLPSYWHLFKNVSNMVVHPVRKWVLYMTSTGMGFSSVITVGLQTVTTFLSCVIIYTTIYIVGHRIKHCSQSGKLFSE